MSVALTRSRFINALRCYASYALSLFGSVRIFHGPMFVSVEPANICQLRCPECPVGKGERRKVKGVLRSRWWIRRLHASGCDPSAYCADNLTNAVRSSPYRRRSCR